MYINISGKPEEIAALAKALQERPVNQEALKEIVIKNLKKGSDHDENSHNG